MILSFSLLFPLCISLHLFDHCHGYLQSKTSSVASSRSIGLFVRFYWPMFCHLFSAASVSLPSSLLYELPLSQSLWLSSGIDPFARTWLTVANLITGLPHLVSALCIFFSLLHAQVYLLALQSYFFCPLFLFHRAAPRTNPSQHSPFLRTSSAFSFSAKLCGKRDCS